MIRNNVLSAAIVLVLAVAGVVIPSPVAADDFTFEVPVQLSNVAPGAINLNVRVNCFVSTVVGSVASGNLVAQQRQTYSFLAPSATVGAGPVTDSRVLTFRMNASRVRPASEARYWHCGLGVGAEYPDGLWELATSPAEAFERVTGRRRVRAVIIVEGEIPRR